MMMRRAMTFCLTAALLMSPLAIAVADDEKKPQAEITPIAISITKPIKSDSGQDLVFGQPGTELTLLIKGNGKRVIEVNRDRSKITSFKDNLGNSLTKPKDWGLQFWQPADDGSMGTIRFSASGFAAEKATGLVLKGELAMVLGSKTKTQEAKNVALEKGTAFKVGDIPCKIVKAGEASFSDSEMEINLEFKQDITEIAEVVFLDKEGDVLESSRTGSMTSRFGNRFKATVTYELKNKADAATIQFKLWTDMEKVKVPVDLSFGLGL